MSSSLESGAPRSLESGGGRVLEGGVAFEAVAFTELEWSLRLQEPAVTGDTYEFAVFDGATSLPGPIASIGTLVLAFTELEWSLNLQSPAVDGDIYEFAVFDGSTFTGPIASLDARGGTLNDADVLYLGGALVNRVYCGAVQVWP